MTLEKSKSSALILSTLTVISFAIVDGILNILLPYWFTGDVRSIIANPDSLRQPASLLGLIVFLVIILVLMIGIGAYWLYRFFGPKYYSLRGAFRWVLFGALFALFLKLPDWLFSTNLWALKLLFQLAGLFAAFFLARWIVPLQSGVE
jgi:hypothetical protein